MKWVRRRAAAMAGVTGAELSHRPQGATVVRDRVLGELLFPPSDRVIAPRIAQEGVWEPLEGYWLRRHLEPGSSFLNVGANVGYFCLLAAAIGGPTTRITAVEPNSDNVEFLRANLAAHGVSAQTLHAAAGDTAGVFSLHLAADNCGDHRLGPLQPGAADVEQVPCLVLDDVVPAIDADIIMTDTQGWDHRVLRGLARTIAARRPLILTEFTPAWVEESGESPAAILDWIDSLGYWAGILDAGAVPGQWEADKIVAWSRHRGFATMELWPKERPFTPLVTPSEGFWAVEADGDELFWWLFNETGVITVRGPAGRRGAVHAVVSGPPQTPTASIEIAGRSIEVTRPQPVRIPVELDARGYAEIPVSAPAWVNPSGDHRRLHMSVRGPRLELR